MKSSLLFLFLILFQATSLEAQMGKVFFADGNWLKGEIKTYKDSTGKEFVTIVMKSGSVTIQKSEIKNIIYHSKKSDPSRNGFKNSPSKSKRLPIKLPLLYDPYIRLASTKYQIDPELIRAVIKQESNFNRKNVSKKGAQGLMQLMPETARKLGVEDSFDPWENINGGTRYLRMMLENFDGDLVKALAAYNAGPNTIKRYGKAPPYQETQQYIRNILRQYRASSGTKLFAFEDKNGRLVITDQCYLP